MTAKSATLHALAGGFLAFSICHSVASAAVIPPILIGQDVVSRKKLELPLAAAARGTVIVFLSAKCPCSASHEITLQKLAAEFGPAGFRFVGINANADEPLAMAETHFTGSGLSFPVLRDDGARLADAFGAYKTPHAFVVDAQGTVLFQGGVDDSHDSALARKAYLKEALRAIQAGKEPPVREVRSLGCVIKRP